MTRLSLRALLLSLSAGTVMALLWNQYGMNVLLMVDAHTAYPVQLFDDRAGNNQGHSVATLRRDGDALVMLCDVRAGYQYPFCQLSVRLGTAPEGIDLSGYETLKLWVRVEGPEPTPQVRFALRNFNPAYSRMDNDETLKNQELILTPPVPGQPVQVRLAQFSVASWWIEEHNIAVESAGLEFDHIVSLDLTTGSSLKLGPHVIALERAELHGKLISPARLRLMIIGVWLLAVLAYLAVDGMATRRQLRASRRSQASLQQINDALRMESAAHAELARHDPLTGLLNRKGLGDALQRLAGEQGERLFPLSLVFVDIDHFKRINDEHGHAVGDEVIRQLGERIRSHVQRSDLVTRWGGEEFLLVCPRTSLDQATGLAERLRLLIEAAAWPEDLRVTSCFGVADAADGQQLREGIDRADRAMYEAKQRGRNQVRVQGAATPLPAAG